MKTEQVKIDSLAGHRGHFRGHFMGRSWELSWGVLAGLETGKVDPCGGSGTVVGSNFVVRVLFVSPMHTILDEKEIFSLPSDTKLCENNSLRIIFRNCSWILSFQNL